MAAPESIKDKEEIHVTLCDHFGLPGFLRSWQRPCGRTTLSLPVMQATATAHLWGADPTSSWATLTPPPCPEQQDDDIIVLPHVKDDTDTEYAAKLVSEKGFDEVLLLGGLGGRRVEHTLANLCTGLGLEQRGVRTTLLDERSRITYVMPGETRRYPKEKYFFFSAFPMEGRAQGVCERGSYYELTDAELTASYPLGVSNEYAAGSDCITISTRSGALVVVETIAD